MLPLPMPRAHTIFSLPTLVRSICSSGLKPWLSSVRRHDSQFDGLGFHSISSVTGTKPRLPPFGGGVDPGPAARAGVCAWAAIAHISTTAVITHGLVRCMAPPFGTETRCDRLATWPRRRSKRDWYITIRGRRHARAAHLCVGLAGGAACRTVPTRGHPPGRIKCDGFDPTPCAASRVPHVRPRGRYGRGPGTGAGPRARDLRSVGPIVSADAADAGGSGGCDRHLAERAPLLRARQRQACAAHRTAPRREGGLGARGSRSAGAGALRRAHAVRGHAALSGKRDQQLPGITGAGDWSRRQRRDELRRHAVHAAHSGRFAAGTRSRAPRARRLGPRRHLRTGRHRPPARHRAVRMAVEPRRGRAHPGQDPAGPARGIALRESSTDRRPRGDRKGAARTAGALLSRLVPSRSDGGDRRRRRGSRRRRCDDQGALLVARLAGDEAAPAGVRRARARGHALHRDHRQGGDGLCGRDQQPAAGAPPGFGGRLPADHDGPAVRRHARRAPRRARSAREPAVSASRRRPPAVRHASDEGRGPAPGVGSERRCHQGARRARDRNSANCALRVHRHRAGARQAGEDAQLRAQRDGESRPRVVEPRR